MTEPPAKRPRRTDSAAMWNKSESSSRSANHNTASPQRSPRPSHISDHDGKSRSHQDPKSSGYDSKREEDDVRRRRRSKSPRDRPGRKQDGRPRSRSPKDRGHKDRTRERVKDEDRKHTTRERSRSRDRDRNRQKSSKGDRSDQRCNRSRSPYRNGESASSIRQRSPLPRSRVKHEDRDSRKDQRDVKPASVPNGNQSADMDVDDADLDSMMKRMMGFSTFKTTQNTKIPGNNIYGVRKEKKTEYRQYMNRVGGFNRPLSPG